METGDIFVGGYSGAAAEAAFSPEQKLTENFAVEDLLVFSNEDAIISNGFLHNVADNSTDSSNVTPGGDNHLSSADLPHSSQFSGELCVPYDDVVELEWLSNFVEDSFSPDQNLQSNLRIFATPESSSSSTRFEKILHPTKARSKRSQYRDGISKNQPHISAKSVTPKETFAGIYRASLLQMKME
ncbi:hypothetical protein V6N13_077945 [Hibiscus sabdariffa]|uniref:GATA transcription factor n=1 Tax=Hibiscus sabdariffa TaxID=183260 RepID=A0ABR2RM52_9ROSI